MGDIYVKQYAAAGCAELSGRALRVLLRMALVVYDEPTPPDADNEGLYFGGWKGLTVCLGYGVITDDEPIPPTTKRVIARAIAELKTAGYLTVAPRRNQGGHWGKRVYRLSLAPCLDALNTPARV